MRPSRLQHHLNQALIANSAIAVIPRGGWVPYDPFLRGEARFAKKIGSTLGCVIPQNQTALTEGFTATRDYLIVDELQDWMVPDAQLQIAGRETCTILYITESTKTLFLDATTSGVYEAGTSVWGYTYPITVEGDYEYDSGWAGLALSVHSNVPLFSGDQLVVDALSYACQVVFNRWLLEETLLAPDIFSVLGVGKTTLAWTVDQWAGYRIAIVAGTGIGQSGLIISNTATTCFFENGPWLIAPDGTSTIEISSPITRVYSITLAAACARDLADDEIIGLRVYPGYDSGLHPIAVTDRPFAVDWISGYLTDGEIKTTYHPRTLEEVVTLYLHDDASTLFDTIDDCGKNKPILYQHLSADCLALADLGAGSIVLQCDDIYAKVSPETGQFHLTLDIFPNWPIDQAVAWNMTVFPDTDCIITVQLEPGAAVAQNCVGGMAYGLGIGLPVPDEATRFHLFIQAPTANCMVKLSRWVLHGHYLRLLRYTQVSHVIGSYDFGTSGLLLKPYWPTLDPLRIPMLDHDRLDGGQALLGSCT